MENSALIARIMGPALVIIAAGMLVNFKNCRKLLDEFTSNTALTLAFGLMSIVLGLLVIQFHNVWKLHWSLIITISGWSMLIKGIILNIAPSSLGRWTQIYKKNSALLVVWLILAIAIGIFLAIMGYVA